MRRTERLDAEDLTWSAVRFKFSSRKTCELVGGIEDAEEI